MINIFRIILICFSAVAIIVADSFLKKISTGQSFLNIIKDPWMILVLLLYLIQIFFVIFLFIFKIDLAIYSNLFIIFYGIFGVVIGLICFKESLSPIQMCGIGLGLIGAVMMNL